MNRKECNLINLESIINIEFNYWVINKRKPTIPIVKIKESDFTLISNGIYYSQNNKIEFNGKVFYLPKDLFDEIKVKLKQNLINENDLGISHQEFTNKEIIDLKDFNINIDYIKNKLSINNIDNIIYCSNNTKNNYQDLIKKIIEKLRKENIYIKRVFFLNNNRLNQNDDINLLKKKKLISSLITNYKTDNLKFINKEFMNYSTINLFDTNDINQIEKTFNIFFNSIIEKTDVGLKDVIIENIKNEKPLLNLFQITNNKANPLITKSIKVEFFKIFKTFETFTYLFFK